MSFDTLKPYSDCPTFEVLITDGDQLPEFAYVLKGVNLLGYTMTLTIKRPSGVLVKTATFPDAANGQFVFSWDVGDLIAGPGQYCLLRSETPGGLKASLLQFFIDVNPLPGA